MTRIEPCKRCGRRLVIKLRGMCASCSVYSKGQVTPTMWRNKSVPVYKTATGHIYVLDD